MRTSDQRRQQFRSKPATISDSIPPHIPSEVHQQKMARRGAGTDMGYCGTKGRFQVNVRLMRRSGHSSTKIEDPEPTRRSRPTPGIGRRNTDTRRRDELSLDRAARSPRRPRSRPCQYAVEAKEGRRRQRSLGHRRRPAGPVDWHWRHLPCHRDRIAESFRPLAPSDDHAATPAR